MFYSDQAVETLIDTHLPTPPASQNLLLDSLRLCNDLVQRDMRYAHLVAGASKMPMDMIWAARNQDELVNDTDLAKLKSLTWNEFIQKRYLPAITGGQSPANAASSMLEIVREMNLQRRRFQIMGLHEQVEASEIQLVLHLCQARILHPTANAHGEYRSLANRFRRHDRFYEAFALAVGAFVCSSAPFTLGAATTRYERDLQYEYKKHTTALFVYVLQQHPGALVEAAAYDEDYVLRISRLIVVWPSSRSLGGDGAATYPSAPDIPPPPPRECQDKELLMGAIVSTQTMAEKAEFTAGKAVSMVRKEVGACNAAWRAEVEELKGKLVEESVARSRAVHEVKEHADQLVIGWLSSSWKEDEQLREKNPLFDDVRDVAVEILRTELDAKIKEKMETLETEVNTLGGKFKAHINEEMSSFRDGINDQTRRISEANQERLNAFDSRMNEFIVKGNAVGERVAANEQAITHLLTTLQAVFGNMPSAGAGGGNSELQNVTQQMNTWAAGVEARLRAEEEWRATATAQLAATEAEIATRPGKEQLLTERIQTLEDDSKTFEKALEMQDEKLDPVEAHFEQIHDAIRNLAESLGWDVIDNDLYDEPDFSVESADGASVNVDTIRDLIQTVAVLKTENNTDDTGPINNPGNESSNKRARADGASHTSTAYTDDFVQRVADRVIQMITPIHHPAPPAATADQSVEARLARLEDAIRNAGLDGSPPAYGEAGGGVLPNANFAQPSTPAAAPPHTPAPPPAAPPP